MDIERRYTSEPVEIRSGAPRRLVGYAGVHYLEGHPETEYELWEGARERFLPGAFADVSSGEEVVAYFNHDPNLILGRRSAGTLRVEADERGLHYELDLGQTSTGADVLEHVRRRDVTGASIGFIALEDRWRREDGLDIREIVRARVLDLGPVSEPAYAGSSAEARALGDVEHLRARAQEAIEGAALERTLAMERRMAELGVPARRTQERLQRAAERTDRGGRRLFREQRAVERLRCGAGLMGVWAVEPGYLSAGWDLYRSGLYPLVRSGPPEDDDPEPPKKPGYSVLGSVAVIRIDDVMTKRASSLGGTSTIHVRQQIRRATADPAVRGILLAIDSPGGTVSGLDDLAWEVRRARRRGVPVHAHADDLCASAAYYVGSQAAHISAGPTAEVGSIGTMAVVYDTSEAYAREGIRVHLVASGPRKGDFTDGVPVQDEALAALRRSVEEFTAHFVGAVSRGRGIGLDVARSWATGDVWGAQEALERGLIDSVERFDDALGRLQREIAAAGA